MNNIQILNNPSKEEPFLIISKPSRLPTAPLSAKDTNNALYLAAQQFPQILTVNGKKQIEYGLIHRIDTVTQGLVLIATTQESYNFFIEQQKNNNFTKYYTAICENKKNLLQGFPPFVQNVDLVSKKSFSISSYFRYYGQGRKEVRPIPVENQNKTQQKKVEGSKIYTTNVKIVAINNQNVQVECQITNGFKHQVRSHLAWANLPIQNDPLYNPQTNNLQIQFFASKLEFIHPITNKKITFQKDFL